MDKVLGFLIFLVILYGVYNAQSKEKISVPKSVETCVTCKIEIEKLHLLEKELSMIETPQYIKQYIADKIACYVLELSGRRCETSYPEDAQMFYTSICGGCHGDDGKGQLGRNYPDLTQKKLLGLEMKEESLRRKIEKLKRDESHQHR